jgi:hypothetical protein
MTAPADAWSDKDGLRWYTFEGIDYISVTSMRKVLGMPYPLHNWVLNQMMDAVIAHPGIIRVAPGESNDDARKRMRAAATVERDRAAERGTEVHAAIASGRPIHEAPEELRPFIHSYAKAVLDLSIKPLLTEKQVFNKTMGYAGSFDLLAMVKGVPTVIDLKTGKGIYPEHALQGYSYLKGEFVAEGGVIDDAATDMLKTAKAVAVLHLTEEGYAYHEVRIDKALDRAWYATCVLAQFFIHNKTLETLEVK